MVALIQVQHFTKKYGDKAVVKDISFTAKDGAITGFIGHNGAGKSTTIKAITGVISPTEGTILINGIDIARDALNAKRQFGYVSDSPDHFQKIMIMGALIHDPSVWILDEPLTGLDPQSAFELKKMMREHVEKGNSVFFSTHVLEVAEKLCDEICIIKNGELLYNGTLDELKSTYKSQASLENIFLELTETKESEA